MAAAKRKPAAKKAAAPKARKSAPKKAKKVEKAAPVAAKKAEAPKSAATLTPDETARYGAFARVVEGEHDGRYGVVDQIVGKTAVLVTRDDDNLRLEVPLKSLRPDVAGRR